MRESVQLNSETLIPLLQEQRLIGGKAGMVVLIREVIEVVFLKNRLYNDY